MLLGALLSLCRKGERMRAASGAQFVGRLDISAACLAPDCLPACSAAAAHHHYVAPLAVPIRNNFTMLPTCHPPAAWRSACRTAARAAASCPSSASTSASAGLEAQAPMGSRRGLGWALGGACLQRTAGNGAVSTGEHRSAARPWAAPAWAAGAEAQQINAACDAKRSAFLLH